MYGAQKDEAPKRLSVASVAARLMLALSGVAYLSRRELQSSRDLGNRVRPTCQRHQNSVLSGRKLSTATRR